MGLQVDGTSRHVAMLHGRQACVDGLQVDGHQVAPQ